MLTLYWWVTAMMLLQLPSASAAAMAVDAPAPAAPAPPADAMALWENDTLQRVFRVTLNVRRAARVLCACISCLKLTIVSMKFACAEWTAASEPPAADHLARHHPGA